MNEAIQIFVRMRPLLPNEDEEAWKVDKENNTIISLPRDPQTTRRYADAFYNYSFTFDRVFSTHDNTASVYENCKSLLNQVMQGYNASLFLYGQTTSGKTYTMLGDQTNPGILPFTLLELFQDSSKIKFISYIEIYNEQINDLLQIGATNLKMQDANGIALVQQMKQAQVDNFDDALNLLCFGEEQRCYREKQIHEHSSRSHTIFQITILHNDNQQSALSLIDLAGSERLHEEDVSDETAYINKSLFVLSNVINKLAEGKKTHIPYRDSKLTRYLQNSLGGNSFTTIICTLSPASMNFNQTLSTLRFAQRAKKVQNKISKYEQKQLYSQDALLKEIQDLKNERDALLQIKCSSNQNSNNIQQVSVMMPDLYIQYYQSICADKEQFQNESVLIKEKYIKSTQLLDKQFQQALAQIAEIKNSQIFDTNLQFLLNFKEDLNRQIEQEIIFNNVYVQSILNPTQNSDFQQYQTDELLHILQKAYQEATVALNVKQQDTNALIQEIGLGIIQKQIDIKDEQSVKNYQQLINQEFQWIKQCKLQIQEQLRKKLSVLSQAFKNVQKNLNTVEMRYSQSQTNSLHVGNNNDHIQNIPMPRSSTPTPKFTDRDKTVLFVWGSGKDGRLGTGNQLSQAMPIKICGNNYIQISCGYYHSAAITIDNDLYVWGKNCNGLSPSLNAIQQLKNVQQVSCGWQHTLALLNNGNIMSWGIGDEGQLGHGTYNSISQPKIIEQLENVLFISAGHSHSAAILNDNSLYTWGCNIDYRLMLKDNCNNQSIPQNVGIKVQKVSLGANHTGAILQDNTLIMGGCGSFGQLCKQVNDNNWYVPYKSVNDVQCGEDYTIILIKGQVYSCGKKSNGTLGHPMQDIPANLNEPKQIQGLNKIVKIAVGKRHCLAISVSKEVWGWGFNFYDQLGLGDKNKFAELPIKLNLSDVINVACGEYHSMAICQS